MNRGRRIGSIGLRLVICAALLTWIFHAIFLHEGQQSWEQQGLDWHSLSRWDQWRTAWSLGPAQLWRSMRLVTPAGFGLSLVCMGFTILLGAWRWDLVMRVHGLNLPFGRCLEISLVAQFFNAFLLGSTGGDLLKAYYAARETHHKKTEAVVTVFADRLIGLFSMLSFAGLMMLPNRELLGRHRSLASVAILVLAMWAACSGLVALAFWGGVSRGWPRAREWMRRLPKGEYLERSLDASRRFGHDPAFLARTLGISMVLNVACVLQIIALAGGLRLDFQPRELLLVVPMIICIAALPITPSGLGLRENLYVLLLASPQIQISATKALSLSLLAYAGFIVWSLIGGIVYLRMKQTQHLDEVTHPPAALEEAP